MRRLTVIVGAIEALRRYARNNPEKVNRYADQAARFVDKRTKGKYSRQLDDAVRKVRSSTTTNPHQGYRH
ncbi:MAG TPA: antitoxin [Pseudonocardiaceae bacterium]|nr:antitoxin [Pseudonocardiaceae bacterium]